MKYIAVLDYEHLDNGLFLTSVAKAFAEQQNRQTQLVVVHGESEYTERLIQTGIMREEATVRAIKDLNHRLIALFADQGVSAVGLNGYQRECITLKDDTLDMDLDYFNRLHQGPVLVLSNLVLDEETARPVPVPLPRYLAFLHAQFSPNEVFLFSKYDHISPAAEGVPSDPQKEPPEELAQLSFPTKLTTAEEFRNHIADNN
ncbi:hypothetical protein NC796_05120 [Aliifodinibius sp. S!AR15-10]|uniref:amino acid kinase family protein n=1 Tax=Aliifodinibius sp. S!AR15-10 TaxID=2950437 RepID=UPI0028626421|nr:hypothetical protein [Aliifodinibius sp. S!AR15-10]MDR8390511.1 hypothetical protein [Aliifodinibius sp. S!AR15-10]